MGKVDDPAGGVIQRLIHAKSIKGRGSNVHSLVSLGHNAHAHPAAGAVAAAQNHRRARQKAAFLRGCPGHLTHHRIARTDLGKFFRIQARRFDEAGRPAFFADIEGHGAGGIGIVRHIFARQLHDDEVLAVEGFIGILIDFRLVFLDPHELGQRIIGAFSVPAGVIQLLFAISRRQLLHLLFRAAVCPDDGIPQWISVFIDAGAAHHLPAKGDGGNRLFIDPLQNLLGAVTDALPPVQRILLHRPILSKIGGVIAVNALHHFSIQGKQNCLVPAGSHVMRQNVLAHMPFLSLYFSRKQKVF